MKVGDHGALRVDAFAACEHDAFGSAGLEHDAAHRRAEPHLAAGRGDGARTIAETIVSAPPCPSAMPKLWFAIDSR